MDTEPKGGEFWGGAYVYGLKQSPTDCSSAIREKAVAYGRETEQQLE